MNYYANDDTVLLRASTILRNHEY